MGASGYPGIDLRPVEAHSNESFLIALDLGWRSLELRFLPGPFAGPLISEMGAVGQDERLTFSRLAAECATRNAVVTLTVNGVNCPIGDVSAWPGEWRTVELALRRSPAIVNTEDEVANDAEVLSWMMRFTGLTLALLPVERLEDAVQSNPEGLPEGASVRVVVNRYERSQINRANCLTLHGSRCKACDLDFGEAYGAVGEGFIHVHHVVPVSQLGPDYIIDPLMDLVPLCPNCHAMAHRADPPIPVGDIRDMLSAGSKREN